MKDTEEKLLDIAEVGHKIHARRTKIYELIQAGDLAPIKRGRSTLFLASEIFSYIQRLANSRSRGKTAAAPSGVEA